LDAIVISVMTPATRFLLATLSCTLVSLGCGRAATNSPKGPDVAVRTPLSEAARALVGTWRCSGSLYGIDGAPSPSEVGLELKLDLHGAWLKSELRVTSGKYPYGFNAYRTFDPSASQWVSVIVDNMGGHAVSRSADGVVWTGESTGPMGKIQIRDTETLVSPGEMKMLGQYSPDGESWSTGYDLSCRK
jgi:hypothetical protein